MISSKPPNILFPSMVLWCIIMSWSVMQKDWLLFSRSGSLRALTWSKYENLYCIFWTADPFATKLGLMVLYHKPENFMEKLDCCVKGKSHSKISKCQWVFVQMIFSKLLNHLLPNLVYWYIIISQIVFQTDLFAVFKVKSKLKVM